MYSERIGQGTLLVCLHGWGMNGRMEQADFESLFEQRPGWERLYIDLPGMGRSPAQTTIHNFDDLLAALLAFIDEQAAGQPYALSGTSAGAYLARGVAARRPQQVAGLMLRVPRVHPEWQPRDLPSPTPLRWPADAAALAEKERRWVQPALQACDTAFLDGIRHDPHRYSFRQVPEQQPFTGPALIVTGRQDTVTGYRDAWTLLEHYPRASFAVLDRAGHEWPLPLPRHRNVFAALVGEWLERVEDELQLWR